jgi:hypothetical protein
MAVIVTVHGTFAGEDDDVTGERKKSIALAGKTGTAKPELTATESATGGSAPGKLQWDDDNSHFARRIRELVNGADGKFQWETFKWNGKNSEASRRQAARLLLTKLVSLEEQKSPYVVIGHSHGGSVLAFALQLATKQAYSLSNMSAWMTVGTPFLHHRKKSFLYARGDSRVKGVILIALTIIISGVIRFLSVEGLPKDITDTLLLIGVTLVLTIGTLYIIKRYVETDPDYKLLKPSQLQKAQTSFEARRISFYHPNDEAIQGLSGLKANQVDLFQSDFATNFLIAPLIPFLLPLALVLALFTGIDEPIGRLLLRTAPSPPQETIHVDRNSPFIDYRSYIPPGFSGDYKMPPLPKPQGLADKLVPDLQKQTPPQGLQIPFFGENDHKRPKEEADRINRLSEELLAQDHREHEPELNKPSVALFDPGRWYSTDPEISSMKVRPDMSLLEAALARVQKAAMIVLAFPILCFRGFDYIEFFKAPQTWYFATIAVVTILSIAYVSVAWVLARILSIFVSRWLSVTTRDQVKALAFGSDVPAETVSACSPAPPWQTQVTGLLKDDVNAEITDLSDKAAAAAIGKFRGLISDILSGSDVDAVKSKIAEIINWQELVHTTYFSSEKFIMTVCKALVRTSSFKSREQAFSSNA